jgi:peptidoglycan/xylan/chitin deacetylase (PgdA/CDA1 family)
VHPLVAAVSSAAGATAALASAGHAYWRRALGEPPAGMPAVLAYHKVGTPELGGTWCTVRQLRTHLDALQRAGYSTLGLGDFERRLETHAVASPASRPAPTPRELLVTFDDAFESFAMHAWPELERRGMRCTVFVVTDFVGRPSTWDLSLPGRRVRHLDWDELRALALRGVEIGSHAATHRDLRRLEYRELEHELAGSRKILEDRLGLAVRAVAYPFGRFDLRVRQAALRAGFTLGFSMCPPGPNRRVDRLALRRSGVYITDRAGSVLDKVDPARRAFWLQDVTVRAINACAALGARAGTTRRQPMRSSSQSNTG